MKIIKHCNEEQRNYEAKHAWPVCQLATSNFTFSVVCSVGKFKDDLHGLFLADVMMYHKYTEWLNRLEKTLHTIKPASGHEGGVPAFSEKK